MPLCLAQIVMPYATGLPGDVAVNTLHFGMQVANDATADLVSAAIVDFYNTDPVGTASSIALQLSPKLSGDAFIRYYNLSQPAPRVPFSQSNFVLDLNDLSLPLPEEVAVVLSFHAAIASGDIAARKRNRVFIGPLNQATVDTDEPFAMVQTVVSDTLVEAAQRLKAASQAAAGVWTWEAWSPTAGTSAAVVGGWVDNAFDTQRRRGPNATLRTLWA